MRNVPCSSGQRTLASAKATFAATKDRRCSSRSGVITSRSRCALGCCADVLPPRATSPHAIAMRLNFTACPSSTRAKTKISRIDYGATMMQARRLHGSDSMQRSGWLREIRTEPAHHRHEGRKAGGDENRVVHLHRPLGGKPENECRHGDAMIHV